MAFLIKKNNAATTLNGAISDADLTMTVTLGMEFPAVGDFILTIWDKNTYPNPGDDPGMEIVRATARTVNVITITRAQEFTTAVGHASGSAVELLLTAGTLNEAFDQNLTKTSDVLFNSVSATVGINDTAGTPALSIDPNNRQLYHANGATVMMDWTGTPDLAKIISFGDEVGVIRPIFANGIANSNQTLSIDTNNHYLVSTAGATTVDYHNKYLYDASNYLSLDWGSKATVGTAAPSDYNMQWGNRDAVGNRAMVQFNNGIMDQSTYLCLDTVNRALFGADGVTIVANWSVAETNSGTKSIYFPTYIVDGSNYISIDTINRVLRNGTGFNVMFWTDTNGYAYFPAGICDASGVLVIDNPNRILRDTSNYESVDWQSRQLMGTDGTTVMLDYNSTSAVQLVPAGGNALIGTAVDDGTNRLQVSGKTKSTDYITDGTSGGVDVTGLALNTSFVGSVVGSGGWSGEGFAFGNLNAGTKVFGLIYNSDTAWFGSATDGATWFLGAADLNNASYAVGALATGMFQANDLVYSNTAATDTVFQGAITADTANYVGSLGYWAIRTGTDYAFNLDVYNGGSPINVMKVSQTGQSSFGTGTVDASYGRLQANSSLGGYVFVGYDAVAANQMFWLGNNQPSSATVSLIFGCASDGGAQVGGPASGNYVWCNGLPLTLQDYSAAGIDFYMGANGAGGFYPLRISSSEILFNLASTVIHAGTDYNLGIGVPVLVTGAISYSTFNDARDANIPFEIRSLKTVFTQGNVFATNYSDITDTFANPYGNIFAGTGFTAGVITAIDSTGGVGNEFYSYNTAYLGLVSQTGWSGNGFLFTNVGSGFQAFSMVMNGDIGYFGFINPRTSTAYNALTIDGTTGNTALVPTSGNVLIGGAVDDSYYKVQVVGGIAGSMFGYPGDSTYPLATYEDNGFGTYYWRVKAFDYSIVGYGKVINNNGDMCDSSDVVMIDRGGTYPRSLMANDGATIMALWSNSTTAGIFLPQGIASYNDGVQSINTEGRTLIASDTAIMLDWSTSTGVAFPAGIRSAGLNILTLIPETQEMLDYGGAYVSLDWGYRLLKVLGVTVMNWDLQQVSDTSGYLSLDWTTRQLFGANGSTPIFNWNGGISYPTVTTYTSTPNTIGDYVTAVICDSASAMVVNLPLATGSGRVLKIKNVGAGVVTVTADATGTADTIDGSATYTLTQYNAVEIYDYAADKWAVL